MTWLGAIMYGTVVLWLAPGSLFRPVALALLIQWGAGELIFLTTGDYVPAHAYIPFDMAVIFAVLFLRSHWSDWLIIAPYPLVWWLYLQPETREQWIALYTIALVQFLIAGPWPNIGRALQSYTHGPLRAKSKVA